MNRRLFRMALVLMALATVVGARPLHAQSDILLRLRSGSPLGERFRVDSAGGVIAVGTLGIGIIPAVGAGSRFMWHPFKNAFRSGQVSGSEWDDSNIGFYSWAGGLNAKATNTYSFAFGNAVTASGTAAVALGSSNTVTGTAGFSVGISNTCNGAECIAMGNTSTADGASATAIGYRATASADYSVAIGYRAATRLHTGAMIFSDASTTDSMQATANHEFAVRAAGGIRLRSNATQTTGCNLAAGGGSWTCTSSKSLKKDFISVEPEAVLGNIRRIPINTWRYKDEVGGALHMGPFAEDFRGAFGLGTDDKSIGMVDIDGVNFAAVKGLEARTAQQAERIRSLEAELSELRMIVHKLMKAESRNR